MVELGFEPAYLSALSAVFHFSLAIAYGVSKFIIPIHVTDEAQSGELGPEAEHLPHPHLSPQSEAPGPLTDSRCTSFLTIFFLLLFTTKFPHLILHMSS